VFATCLVFPFLLYRNTDQSFTGYFSLVISGLFFLVTVRLAIEALIDITTTELAITNQRVIAKTGLFHQHTIEILLSKVESIKVSQNILGKLMNFGTVTVVGTGGTKESFRAIIDPLQVRNKVNQIIQQHSQATSASSKTA
ncbi:MAG TPA: PH domain-containing protein, partial [Anaerolineales bacterium]|nr:PH domain-containing protein [Anaerolineales bacterium]